MPNQITSRRAFAIVAFASFALVACGSDADDSAEANPTTTAAAASGGSAAGSSDLELDGHTFLSTEVTGETLAPDARLTLAFEDGRVAVLGGCNTLNGGYEITDGVLEVGQMAQTSMACEDDLMSQDEWVAAMLTAGPTITLEDDVLTLATDDITIVFGDREEVATSNPLDGTAWQMDSFEDEDGNATEAPEGATLAFAGDEITLSTGCNRGFGSVEVSDSTLTFGPIGLTRMACVGDVGDWEIDVTTILDGEVSYKVSDDSLVLTKDGATLTLSSLG